jgi:predicted SAM-dependent methyltransferase
MITKTKQILKSLFFPKKSSVINISNLEINELNPKIHLGCGDIKLNGWINVDARNADHIHINTENLNLIEFTDNSIGVIYLSHVLEHFDFNESEILLKTFFDKLKTGGHLYISVPDFDSLVKVYNKTNNLELIKMALMGGQDYIYNYHKSIYNNSLLTKLLKKIGFQFVNEYSPLDVFKQDIGDFSTYKIEDITISLCIKAIK